MSRFPAVLALCAAMLLAACDSGGAGLPATATPAPAARSESIIVPAGKPLVIGLSAALSGEQMNLGLDLVAAAALAIGKFGSVRGHVVELTQRDDGCSDPEKAVDVAALFIADTALAGVIGPMCTLGAQAANPRYEAAGVIHISPSATRVDLSEQGEQFFFRTVWRDDVQAAVQATYARRQLGASTAVVLDDGEPYGNALAEEFASRFESAGGRVLSEMRIERGTGDSSPLARQIAGEKPDLVVFEGFNPEGALLVKALGEAGYAGRFIGPDGLLSARDFLATAGPAAEGVILTGGASPGAEFVAVYQALYQRPPATAFALQAHDAVTALLKAVDTAATAEADGSLRIDRATLAKTLREQRFAGLTGSITFDEKGDRRGETPAELGISVYQVENGAFRAVE